KVEVLYNPIDLAAFRAAPRSDAMRARLGAAPTDRLVGTVARVHPRKDLETFVRAAAQVAGTTQNVHFAIVGAAEADVEHAYRQTLDRLVSELGLQARVTFPGAIREIPSVMRALDLFVLTSRHEGFGRVLAEAMAAGCPAVVTDEGALPELVQGGQAGRLAAPADPGAFAAQISALLADP